jgi:hypothetical protein
MARRRARVLLVALTLVVVATVGLKAAEGRFWTLKCSVDRPWLLVVNDPVDPVRYAWVVTFRVTNPTDQAVFYLPHFVITTENRKVYRNVVDFAAENEAEKRLGRELPNVVDLIGELKPGESKEGLAVFPLPDRDSDHFDLYVGGLSNEYKVIEREGRSAVVRKMLLCEFYRAGDAHNIHLDEIRPVRTRWTWR